MANNNPAKTYTLNDFVAMKSSDELTYHNFSIIKKIFYKATDKSGNTVDDCSAEFVEQNVIDFYLSELKTLVDDDPVNGICVKVDSMTKEEVAKYKYQPDILSYDVYGTVQLDFIILLCNGIIDPKDFDLKSRYLILPVASKLKSFLSNIYNAEESWINSSSES